MKVWWCEVHNAEAVNNDDLPEEQTECWLYLGLSFGEKPIAPCRMVEMQLVPADALVIERDESSPWAPWPEYAIEITVGVMGWRGGKVPTAKGVLDALALVPNQVET